MSRLSRQCACEREEWVRLDGVVGIAEGEGGACGAPAERSVADGTAADRGEASEAGASDGSEPLEIRSCPAEGCERALELHLGGLSNGSGERPGLCACLACGHPELYTRKDFPPGLGIGIVVVAALLVPFVPYYLSLVGAAIIDALLYRLAPDVVCCYVCSAEHRGYAREPRHPAFDRTIEERLLYGEKAVMGAPMRTGGTAGAPDPEH